LVAHKASSAPGKQIGSRTRGGYSPKQDGGEWLVLEVKVEDSCKFGSFWALLYEFYDVSAIFITPTKWYVWET
jgi:hypothetical protein